MRPLWLGEIKSPRRVRRRASVPSSAAAMSRLQQTMSAAKVAFRLRLPPGSAMGTFLPGGSRLRTLLRKRDVNAYHEFNFGPNRSTPTLVS
jgi:hypothetical protein